MHPLILEVVNLLNVLQQIDTLYNAKKKKVLGIYNIWVQFPEQTLGVAIRQMKRDDTGDALGSFLLGELPAQSNPQRRLNGI